jgi:hypothetical protein
MMAPATPRPFPKYAARIAGHWWGASLLGEGILHLFEGEAPWLIGTFGPARTRCGHVFREQRVDPDDFPETYPRVCAHCLAWVRRYEKQRRARQAQEGGRP